MKYAAKLLLIGLAMWPLLLSAASVLFVKGDVTLNTSVEILAVEKGQILPSSGEIHVHNGLLQIRKGNGELISMRSGQRYRLSAADKASSEAVVQSAIEVKKKPTNQLVKSLRKISSNDSRESRTTVPETLIARGETNELSIISELTAGTTIDGGAEEEAPVDGMTAYSALSFSGRRAAEVVHNAAAQSSQLGGAHEAIEPIVYWHEVERADGSVVYPEQLEPGTLQGVLTDPETGISWGRWDDGVGIDSAGPEIDFEHAPLHAAVTGEVNTSLPRSLIGTIMFDLVGATLPSDAYGVSGSLDNATLMVNFDTAGVDASVGLTVDGVFWEATGSGQLLIDNTFSGDFSQVNYGGQTDGNGEFDGFVVDPAQAVDSISEAGAAFGYQLRNTDTVVGGVAVFQAAP